MNTHAGMGIKEGKKIKEMLLQQYPGAMVHERLQGRRSPKYDECRYWILDMMIDLYTVPPTVATWRDFIDWFIGTWVTPCLSGDKTLVIVFDNSSKSPRNKADCQKKRKLSNPAEKIAITDICDDGVFPNLAGLIATREMRNRAVLYLLVGVRAHLQSVKPGGARVFVQCPLVAGSKEEYQRGDAVELTDTHFPLPAECNHGEADLLIRTWCDHFLQMEPSASIVVRSIDLDMLPILSAYQTPVYLHIGKVAPKRPDQRKKPFKGPPPKTHAEYIDIVALGRALKRSGIHINDFIYACILAGTDYFNGVTGIGGGRIVATLLKGSLQFSGARLVESQSRVQKLLGLAASRSADVLLSREQQARVRWNHEYWLSKVGVPDPLAGGGWVADGDTYTAAGVSARAR
jgi:hypothetical protein